MSSMINCCNEEQSILRSWKTLLFLSVRSQYIVAAKDSCQFAHNMSHEVTTSVLPYPRQNPKEIWPDHAPLVPQISDKRDPNGCQLSSHKKVFSPFPTLYVIQGRTVSLHSFYVCKKPYMVVLHSHQYSCDHIFCVNWPCAQIRLSRIGRF